MPFFIINMLVQGSNIEINYLIFSLIVKNWYWLLVNKLVLITGHWHCVLIFYSTWNLYKYIQRRLRVLHKARNLGLYYRLLDVRAVIFKMAVRVVTSTSKWLGCDEYWGFFVLNRTCVVFQWETVQVSAFNHWFAHSPVNKPMARRRILIADDRLDSRLPKQSPVLLLVDNACDYKELIVFPNFSFIIFLKTWIR